MTENVNQRDQGKLLFVVSHYTEKVLDIMTPLKIIDKYPALVDFYNGVFDAVEQQIVPSQVYSQLVKNLLTVSINNPIIIKFIITLIDQFK